MWLIEKHDTIKKTKNGNERNKKKYQAKKKKKKTIGRRIKGPKPEEGSKRDKKANKMKK